jgi:hypothetical protein
MVGIAGGQNRSEKILSLNYFKVKSKELITFTPGFSGTWDGSPNFVILHELLPTRITQIMTLNITMHQR